MSEFNKSLAVTMFVGAARAEATARGQFQNLNQAVLPVTAQFRKDGRAGPIVEACLSVLGEDWSPGAEWAEYIVALLKEESSDVE